MKVYLNEISGIADAIISLHMSKRSWTRDFEEDVYKTCRIVLDDKGFLRSNANGGEPYEKFNKWLDSLVNVGWKHITLLRYIDFSCTVEGMHRAGQDDWDAHAKRFGNRILRSSTRLASFGYEMSDWYKGKIIPTDVMLSELGIDIPEKVKMNGTSYVKTVNGYIYEDLKDVQDVKRGLYMLSIPSNFIFKCDITEWGHVYKMRSENSTAHAEVKQCCEAVATALENAHKQFNRSLFEKILN